MKARKALLLFIFLAIFSVSIFPELSMAQSLTIPATGLPNPPGGIKAILENVLKWLLGIFGMIAIISFAVSGIQYFMAAGDEKRAETAKKNMTYSIIGIVVALSALVIIQAVDAMLNAYGGF